MKFYSEKIVNGSTPLARGTRPDARLQRPEYRFNPARAGNSGQSRSHARQRTVQPRSRGELRIKSSIAQISNGSTPLARGTPLFLVTMTNYWRFNPARAGNSVWVRYPQRQNTVQPRSRGELRNRTIPLCSFIGSTPLARGTHAVTETDTPSSRFNPARAGNSDRSSAVYR